ncbi:MAG: D-alanyl-D-alanine carboxypeptidase/D-alanyl-D-alanine endopeptidase [Mycobacteriaceae bacterium]
MRQRRRLVVLGAAALAGVVTTTLIAVVAVRSAGIGNPTAAQLETVAPPTPVVPAPKIHGVSASTPVPVPAVLSTVLAPLAAAPGLGTLTGRVVDPETGAVLWDSGSAVPQLPASAAKVLTVAAALLTLGTEDVVHTRVVASSVPGQVVLVGGGDPTLSTAAANATEHYPGAARLADLVTQLRSSGLPVSSVVVDSSAYVGDALAPGWLVGDIAGGFVAPIEPVMLDGARSNPAAEESPRSATPALDAGRALAGFLGLPSETVSLGGAEPGAKTLADVSSAPLGVRLQQLMLASDNVLAEAVGREVAVARGMPASFVGAAAAVAATLTEAGIDTSGLAMKDISGLSVLDRAPARVLADVLSLAAGGGPHAAALRPLLSDLPVAAATGTLIERFDGASAQPGAGWVRAKTGTLTGVNSLAGVVTDVDGRVLAFALISNGATSAATRPALDVIAATLRTCGCR